MTAGGEILTPEGERDHCSGHWHARSLIQNNQAHLGVGDQQGE